MTVALEVQSERTLAGLPARWVRFDELRVDVLLVSAEGGLWVPAAEVVWGEDRDEAVAEAVGEDWDRWRRGAVLVSTAFGVPWEDLSLSVIAGQLALVQALEDETLEVLRRLDPERLVELRLTCPRPAQVVRALRCMRDYGARTQ